MHSEQINELSTALAKAQGTIASAKKDRENPFFKSSYADLASVWDACRKPLSDNGLSVVQTTDITDKGVFLVTMLAHASGQWISGILPIRPVKDDPQGMGSAITYMRRYALAAIAGVAPEEHDDDGNEASGKSKGKPMSKTAPAAMKADASPTEGTHGGPAGEDLDAGTRTSVTLLSESRRNTLFDLMDFVKPPQKDVDLWLSRAGISRFDDMPEDKGEKIIKFLADKKEIIEKSGKK